MPVITVLIIALKVIVAFSALILIHEFGHFIVAKLSGVWVEEFGLGLPPKIISKKIGETVYSLNALPIGGFVRLHGETSADQVVYKERAFTNKRPLTRIAITFAGIAMNFLFAIVCFAIVYSITGIESNIVDVKILSVDSNSPAATAGIVSGEIVKSVNQTDIKSTKEFKDEIAKYLGKSVKITLDDKVVTLIPRANPPEGQGALGVEISDVPQIYYPPVWQRPFVGAWYGLKQALSLSKAVIFGLGDVARSVGQGKAPEHVVGVVGIFAIFIEFAKIGVLAVLNLLGVVSINLAVINLIPFPPLDGSRIGIVIVETLTRKKITPNIENKIYTIGMIILLLLMLIITSREIPQLVKSGSISNFVNSLIQK